MLFYSILFSAKVLTAKKGERQQSVQQTQGLPRRLQLV